jgi:DNA integrity scanning protein DisA with diadenylate cyclase activity
MTARRLARLHEELLDLEVPLPIDAPGGDVLLDELDYACHPDLHEGRAPRYGALVSLAGDPPAWETLSAPAKLRSSGIELALQRHLADGRASFVVRGPERTEGLVCFDRVFEHEASAVRLRHETSAFVVQRTGTGMVRVCGPEGVITWDGTHWSFKPLAEHHAAAIRRLAPGAAPDVLAGLLELCVHWLSARRVGATLVLSLGDDPSRLERVELSAAVTLPPLYVTHPEHLPSLLSALSQTDRAALVAADGQVTMLGVGLRPSDRAVSVVDSTGGTRHTSARRFSFDEARVIVFVVSADGPVSIFSDGAAAATVKSDLCRSGFPAAVRRAAPPDPGGETTVRCGRCGRALLVDEIRFPGWRGGPEQLTCPVCGAAVVLDVYRAAIRGVRKFA